MSLYKNKYRVETTRLTGWDYSSTGYYFITICVKNMECLFGEIIGRKMMLNEFGRIVQNCWDDLTNHYKGIELDEFIIMPNHVHGILAILSEDVEMGLKELRRDGFQTRLCKGSISIQNKNHHGLFEVIRGLKTFSARRINKIRNKTGIPVWQTRFYDRIIRDEEELIIIREYIKNNPANWKKDEEYVHHYVETGLKPVSTKGQEYHPKI